MCKVRSGNRRRSDALNRRLRLEQLEAVLPLSWSPDGASFEIGGQLGIDQVDPVVALSPQGFTESGSTFVVVWQRETLADYTGTQIWYQVFRGDGTALVAPANVFSPVATNTDRQDPRVAMANDGRFVITWEESTGGGAQQVFYQLFAASGTPVAPAVQVASAGSNNSNPDVYFAPDGKYFAVTWQTKISDAIRNIQFQMVDLAAVGLPTQAFTASTLNRNAFQPQIVGKKVGDTAAASDRLVITWTEGNRTETTRLDIGYNLFSIGNGLPLYSSTQFVTEAALGDAIINRDQLEASIDSDGVGGFVIIYTELASADTDATQNNDIYFRRFDAAGVPIENRRPVVNGTENALQSRVGMSQDGQFVVVYEFLDIARNRVVLDFSGFNANGNRINSGSPVDALNNSVTDGAFQDNPDIAMNAQGNWIVVFGTNVNARGGTAARTPGGFMDILARRFVISSAASAALTSVAPVSAPTSASVDIVLTLNSAIPINAATLQSSTLQIQTATSQVLQATFVGMTSNATGTAMQATYRLLPPGGKWDSADNGIYRVMLASDQIKDVAGNTLTEQTLGTFNVDLPSPDTSAPTIASVGAPTFNSDGSATFTIGYQDNVAVDAAALDSNDVRVTGPGGFTQLASLVSVNDITVGPLRTATYRIVAPGGSWNSADNGQYSINILNGQVRDTSGNVMTAQVAGAFSVDLPAESSPWHNSALAQDVNGDGRVSSIDALYIINRLNEGKVGVLATMGSGIAGKVDVNGDGRISTIDALQVINYLNREAALRQAATAAALPAVEPAAGVSSEAAAAVAEATAGATATSIDPLDLVAQALALDEEAARLRKSGSK